MSDVDPLDPELARALREAPVPQPPSGAQERVLGRLAAVLPALAPQATSPPPGAGASHAPSTLAGVGSLTGKGIALLAASFVAGGAVGGLSVSALHDGSPRIVYVDRPAPAPPSASPSLLAPPSTQSVATVTPVSSGPALHAETHASPSAVASPNERLLIDEARRHLADGDARAALGELDDHLRRFPHAQLEEEREALAIQALVQLGRFDGAQSRAASFRRRWPESVYLPAVDATLRSIP